MEHPFKHGKRYALIGLGGAALFHLAALGIWPDLVPKGMGVHGGKYVVEKGVLTPSQWRDLRTKTFIATTQIIFLTTTGGTTFTIPADCQIITNVEIIGCGGNGSTGGAGSGTGGAGGGSGGYVANTALPPVTAGGTAWYNLAAGGAATTSWFNISANSAPGSTSVGCLANGGGNASGATAGAAASNSGQVGTTTTAGATGGNGGASGSAGAGGAGASGPNGAGANGNNGSGTTGATGGNGDAGHGGAGGAANTGGGAGTEYVATLGGSAGSGGGGGGGSNGSAGASGGLYGAGGGGGGYIFGGGAAGGSGRQAIAVFTYNPVVPAPPHGSPVPLPVLVTLLPPPPGPQIGPDLQPFQASRLVPPVSGPAPQNPPFPGAQVPLPVHIWNIPPPPIPPIRGVPNIPPPSQPQDPTIRGLGREVAPWQVFLAWDFVTWSPSRYELPHGRQQFWEPRKVTPPISGPPPQAPPLTGPRGAFLLDNLLPTWIPPQYQPITVRNLVPPISFIAPQNSGGLFQLFNNIVAGQNLTWCDFDLYTITLFNGQTLRFTTADFDINVLGNVFSSQSVRIDQSQSKAQAHWKIGLDVDTWTVVLMPRPVDIITGATFPDTIGSVPFIQAAHSGYLDAADVQVDRAFFSAMPTWPMPPGGAVPVGTRTIFAGKVAAVDTSDATVVMTLNDYRDLFSVNVPIHFYSAQCRHTLFDAGCNADGNMTPGRFSQGGLVGPGSTRWNIVVGARTNVIVNSNAFGAWFSTNATATQNGGVAPDNTNTAWTIARTSSASGSFIGDDTSYVAGAGQTLTFSLYAKPGTGNFMGFYLSNQAGDPDAVRTCFNLSTGTVSITPASGALTNLSASITLDPSGFYRCSVTATFPSITVIRPYFAPRSTSGQVDGTDPSSTATIIVFGGQVEAAAAPTAYIPTTSAPVTVKLLPPGGSGTYQLGTLTMTSGQNNTFARTVSKWDGTNLKLVAPFPFTINPGDTYTVAAGCDLQSSTCNAFGNLQNFGGQPYIPAPEVLAT